MTEEYTKEESFIKAQKKVKDIIGFYTHLIATVFIIPFIIFLNLELVPQYHWFWFYMAAWFVGLFVHWLVIFKLSKLSIRKDWEKKKVKEIMTGGNDVDSEEVESDYIQELFYMKAKKRVKEVKGFYAFLIVNIFTIPLVTYINLKFAPGFHFFWFVVVGMLFALFMMWLGIFGFQQFGLGKDWQQKKMKELMKKDYGHKI